MRNIKLTIQYNGAAYNGWQAQPQLPTIQVALEEALARITGHPVRIGGSGRTDAGVHSAGQTANFTTTSTAPLKAFVLGMNSILPSDISILNASDEDERFDARRSVAHKCYRYRIYNAPARSAAVAGRVWWISHRLDLAAMERAAALIPGTHDFGAFRSTGCDANHTIRTVHASRLAVQKPLVTYEIIGRGFLRNMVRIVVGTLVEVGAGRMTPEEVATLLRDGGRSEAGPTAPAWGLTLHSVAYPASRGPIFP